MTILALQGIDISVRMSFLTTRRLPADEMVI